MQPYLVSSVLFMQQGAWEESGPPVRWIIGMQISTGVGPEVPMNHPGHSGPQSVGP